MVQSGKPGLFARFSGASLLVCWDS